MNTNTRVAGAALLGFVAATAAFQPAMAEQLKKPKQQVVDTRVTGSIAPADMACDPADAKAGIVCRITGGETANRYPSAPINPAFGF